MSTFAGSRAVADRASQIAAEVPWRFKPEVLAELAKRKLRRKIPQLRDALEGRFRPHHALLVGEMLARIDSALATIDRIGGDRPAHAALSWARRPADHHPRRQLPHLRGSSSPRPAVT